MGFGKALLQFFKEAPHPILLSGLQLTSLRDKIK
jgi:hypothetical protein